MAAAPECYELHYEDETHLETNPHLGRVWHRIGQQPTVPAAGTNRRLTVFGSVEALGRGQVEVVQVRQDSAGVARYLAALEARHTATGRQILLVLDKWPLPCQQSHPASAGGLRGLAGGAAPGPLQSPPQLQGARVAPPQAGPRGHLAPTLRAFVDALLARLTHLGGEPCTIVDAVPQWWIDGHRKEPTGRPPGRPKGAKDTKPRQRRSPTLPAHA